MSGQRPELGSAARPRSAKRLGDTCPQCKTVGELWSSYFTPDGLGSNGEALGARYLTVCQDCGTFYETGKADQR